MVRAGVVPGKPGETVVKTLEPRPTVGKKKLQKGIRKRKKQGGEKSLRS